MFGQQDRGRFCSHLCLCSLLGPFLFYTGGGGTDPARPTEKPRFGAQSLPSARSAQCSKRRVQSGKSIKAFGGNAAGGMVTADQVDLSFVPTFLDAMHNGLRCKQAGVSV